VIGGKLYVAGGTDCCVAVNTLTVYDPVANAWTAKTSMPTARQRAAGAVLTNPALGRDLLYVVGGLNSTGLLGTLEAYDPSTDSWTTKTSMPTSRHEVAAAVVNGVLYAIGGTNGSVVDTVEAYDPGSNSWATKASLPTARTYPVVEAVNGIIYAIGGGTNV